MNPKVDEFLARAATWREEMVKLREIAIDCGLGEELKWGKPGYTFDGSNVAIIQGLKRHCAFMIFKGALLEDRDGLLRRPGQNSHVARRLEFTSAGDIIGVEKEVRAFIAEAIEAEKAGLEVEVAPNHEPPPEELEAVFAEVSGLRQAFAALTPGRRRAYILHFSGAKQSKTRRSRIERCVPGILDGTE